MCVQKAMFMPFAPRSLSFSFKPLFSTQNNILQFDLLSSLYILFTTFTMQYSLSLLAAAAAVRASPLLNIRQGVTSAITPTAPAPSGCTGVYSATFGIAAMNISSSSAPKKRQVTTLSDGQPQANTVSAVPITTISDGQPQASTTQTIHTMAPITQISDGQPQQGPHTLTMMPVSQISDGQVQNPTVTLAPVTVISDGQPQNPVISTIPPVSQISDGQPQAPKSTGTPITQISDGQPQAPKSTGTPISQISDGQPQAPKSTGTPITQISDGQPQAPKSTGTPISQISDGQPQAPKSTGTPISQISDGQPQNPTATQTPVSQKSDGQPNAPSSTLATVPGVSSISDTQPRSSSSAVSSAAPAGPSTVMVACRSNSTLELSINNGVLKDNKGRTGYIASNYQFQFDDPPQAGAIYTAGFSVCNTQGTLALGNSTTFYQCRSGDFYNLYDRNWAPQCNPVEIKILQLQNCA